MADYDVIVIGSGPGGYVAAIRAAQLGLRTAVVEREHIAGICSNWGCIPTKALLRSAEVLRLGRHAADFGLQLDGALTADLAAVVKRSRAIATRMNNGVQFLLKKNKVDVIWGEARLTGVGAIRVAPTRKPPMQPQPPPPKSARGEGAYSADHIIVATGARPRTLPGLEPDAERVWTYFEAMNPRTLPKSLLIVGSGAIGVEFASFYRTMGTEVTVVEMLPQILPAEDAEIAAFARNAFERQGIAIITSARVAGLKRVADGVVARIEDTQGGAREVVAERLIVAAGVVGNIEALGLEEVGVHLAKGAIAVDGACRTNVPGIYAIGDVAGAPMLAHKAEHEAVVCVEAIAGLHPHPIDRNLIPGCTYCHPQVASIGLTEERARAAGHALKVGRFSFAANGKAVALGESGGLVKTIFDAVSGELLGAHLVGPEVTELIQGFAVAMNLETTEEELMHTIFPHPTLSEAMKESVLDAFDKAINA